MHERIATQLPAELDGTGRRTIARRDMAEMLLLGGWALDAHAPDAAAAMVESDAVLDFLVGNAARVDPAEVLNRMKRAGKAGNLPFWEKRYIATGRRMVAELAGSTGDAVPSPAALPPRRFAMEIVRHYDFSAGPHRTRLRLPLPLPGSSLVDLEVTPILPDAVLSHRILPGRLEVSVDMAGPISVGAQLSFTALPTMAEREEAPDPTWLAPSEGPIRVTPEVQALARRLAAGERDPEKIVRTFHDHLLDRFTCGVIHYDRIGGAPASDWVLATGWYDCRLGAALLIALCRARGIPARLVGGYLLWRVPTEHFWAEVHLPGRGWTPFDLLGWDLSAGGNDPAWRDIFAGAVDYRLRTQILPRLFTGPSGGPTASAWHRLVRAIPRGTETRYLAIPDGRLLYREDVRITG